MKRTLTLAFAICSHLLFSQSQLTDIQSTAPRSSSPGQFIVFKNAVYFVAYDTRTGTEIWQSDGTSNNTKLLKDINLGPLGSVRSNLVEFKGKLYFIADDDIHGYQLWETDGTSAGTVRTTDNISNEVTKLIVSGDFIYFFKMASSEQMEVWKSDGTANGTVLVKGDIEVWSDAENLTSAFGLIYFSLQPKGSNNSRVWRTDGTEAGTYPVTGEVDGCGAGPNGTTHPTQFVEYNGSLYFIARTQEFPYPKTVGIIKTDGTEGGTQLVVGIYEGNTDLIEYADVLVYQNKMYFSFFDATRKRFFIWESEGSSGTTRLVYDKSASSYFAPSNLWANGNKLYFTSTGSSGGTYLVACDITTGSSEELKQLTGTLTPPFIFNENYDLNHIIPGLGGGMFIKAVTSTMPVSQIWKSDGTMVGTAKISDAQIFSNMIVFNEQLFFSGMAGQDFELWRTEGAHLEPVLVKNIDASYIGLQSAGSLIEAGNLALFVGHTQDYGTELWSTDGTKQGTKTLDVIPGLPGVFPTSVVSANNKGLFLGNTSVGGAREVYSSDGSLSGTKTVTDLFAMGARATRLLKLSDNEFIVFCMKADQTYSLYRLTLSPLNVTEVKNFGKNSFNVPFSIGHTTVTNGSVYFIVRGAGDEFWTSDGTSARTTKIKDIPNVTELVATTNLFYIASREPYNNPEQQLYRSDGTPEGTVIFTTVKNPVGALNFFPFGDKLVFTPRNEVTGKEIWITDGTDVNTVLLKDLYPGIASGIGRPRFTVVDGTLYFVGNDHRGAELWKTDGTMNGTVLVRDINEGVGSSSPSGIMQSNGQIYFSAFTPATGFEVWTTDGTESNTKLVVDVVAGPTYSNPRHFLKVNNTLLFFAETVSAGEQLFAFAFEEQVTSTVDNLSSEITVYPNPSQSIFNIETEQMLGSTLTVYNAGGGIEVVIPKVGLHSTVDLHSRPPGLYFFRFVKHNRGVTVKVVRN